MVKNGMIGRPAQRTVRTFFIIGFIFTLSMFLLGKSQFQALMATPDYHLWRIRYNPDTIIRDWKLSTSVDRFEIWYKNRKFVNGHNARFRQGQESFDVELNSFAHLTDDEFFIVTNGQAFTLSDFQWPHFNCTKAPLYQDASVVNFNWADEDMVGSVRSQGACGSCWAFAAAGAIESAVKIKHRKDFEFENSRYNLNEDFDYDLYDSVRHVSPQRFVDCAVGKSYDNHGCNGGLPESAFTYAIDQGFTFEQNYPYLAVANNCSKETDLENDGKLKSCHYIRPGDINAVINTVASIGPMSVALDASPLSFRLYKSGIYFDKSCSSTHLSHAVLLTGFGQSKIENKVKKYFSVKNSWGADWGENGYFRIIRKKNHCGISTVASFPLL